MDYLIGAAASCCCCLLALSALLTWFLVAVHREGKRIEEERAAQPETPPAPVLEQLLQRDVRGFVHVGNRKVHAVCRDEVRDRGTTDCPSCKEALAMDEWAPAAQRLNRYRDGSP